MVGSSGRAARSISEVGMLKQPWVVGQVPVRREARAGVQMGMVE